MRAAHGTAREQVEFKDFPLPDGRARHVASLGQWG